LPNFFSKGSKFGQKWPFLDFLNTGKYRQILAGIGIGIWSPEYRYSGIGIYRIGNTSSGQTPEKSGRDKQIKIEWHKFTRRHQHKKLARLSENFKRALQRFAQKELTVFMYSKSQVTVKSRKLARTRTLYM
jgi:hypothetical protein